MSATAETPHLKNLILLLRFQNMVQEKDGWGVKQSIPIQNY